jgi:hypothetical protein
VVRRNRKAGVLVLCLRGEEKRSVAVATQGKRWYRPRNVVLAVVAVSVLWLVWGMYRAVTAKPGRAVDFNQQMYDLAASHQPGKEGDPNAWDSLLQAIELATRAEEQFTAAIGGKDAKPDDWPSDWGFPFDYSAVREARAPDLVVEPTLRVMELIRREGVHDKLSELASRPRALRPKPEGRLVWVMVPEAGRARNLARLCAARMYVAHSAGDEAEQIASFEHALALGRVMASQPLLIERLVGIAIISLALHELRYEMADEPLTPDACRAALAAMERQLDGLPPITMHLEAERLMVLDTVQWTHSDDGRGSGRLLLTELARFKQEVNGEGPAHGITGHPIVNVAGIFFPSKATVVAKVNEIFDEMHAYAEGSRAERDAMGFDFDAEVEALPRGHMLLRMLLPALGRSVASDDQWRMELNGTRLLLALRLYQYDHGKFPERLEELVPSYLQALPVDPVSGRSYGYRRLSPEEDSTKWGYIVYSLGRDGQDDGGAAHPQGKFSALRPDGAGYDFVINASRGEK